jgi:hypothetical protein
MSDRIADLMSRRPTRDYVATLPAHALEEFREQGFTAIGQITTDEEVAWLREVYDAMFDGDVDNVFVVKDVMTRIDEQRGVRVSQIIRPEEQLPELRDTAFSRNGRRLSAQLLGLNPEGLEAWGHMVRKAPKDTESLEWHQDEAFWDPHFDYNALSCWMPLDPATVETGCMSMVPGSHKLGILPHKLGKDDPAVTYIEVADPPKPDETVLRPIEVGGASFHHCRTVHGSGPNRSANVRRAFIFEWQAPPVRRATPNDHPWWFRRHEAMMTLAPERMTPAVVD